jgi:hypothetical protein
MVLKACRNRMMQLQRESSNRIQSIRFQHYLNNRRSQLYYFKRAFTNMACYSEIDLNMTVSQFLNEFQNRLKTRFRVGTGEQMEFVPMQSVNNIDNTEYSPALTHSEQTLYDVFRDNRAFGFYVRVVHNYVTQNMGGVESSENCAICMESSQPRMRWYQCNHAEICNTCFIESNAHGIIHCPICRANPILSST